MAITNQGTHKIKPSTAISVAILGSFVNQPAIWSCAFLHLDLVSNLFYKILCNIQLNSTTVPCARCAKCANLGFDRNLGHSDARSHGRAADFLQVQH